MFVLGHFLNAFASLVDYVLLFFIYIVAARAILSWVSPDPYNPVVRFVHNVTEPLLSRIRKWLRMGYGGIDFSPMIVILVAFFMQSFVVGSLKQIALTLIMKK